MLSSACSMDWLWWGGFSAERTRPARVACAKSPTPSRRRFCKTGTAAQASGTQRQADHPKFGRASFISAAEKSRMAAPQRAARLKAARDCSSVTSSSTVKEGRVKQATKGSSRFHRASRRPAVGCVYLASRRSQYFRVYIELCTRVCAYTGGWIGTHWSMQLCLTNDAGTPEARKRAVRASSGRFSVRVKSYTRKRWFVNAKDCQSLLISPL
ncbi:hypothetical protein TGME49_213590 [Toxoplasma gondii ME49]|uniref:Uncharacterized protein n=2 Tax=Toxoplasma gondii TaxID=5811 RepID=S8GH86_TOXGM|nr:hypothetical protein TGME49_213590 [Toxoplasma gondii ME49]EPT31240.1 hypothetical protein TGME49_213590 [Toxoplasma gondii ME49]KYF43694.1 hypothetical protein TGARI_213590 [Toxoplasma gondii ARI]|eukprot:XP_002371096.1 hypothetical protein TGME49_213590 [Toxoplasma gondii ME49]